MIVVDTSALIAMLLDEPERRRFADVIKQAPQAIVSSATIIEARMVAYGRGGASRVTVLDGIIASLGLQIVPLEIDVIELAHSAFVTYGKGNGHPAALNFGDLFSYALAKSRGLPLLFKGDDFALTDVVVAG